MVAARFLVEAVSQAQPRTSESTVARPFWLDFVHAVTVSAAFAAPALSFVELPWAHQEVALLGALLLLAPAFLVSCVVGAVWRLGARWWIRHRTAAWICILASGGSVALVGVYLSNVLLVDPPTSGKTLHGYAITLVCAAITMAVAARLVRALRADAVLRRVGARRIVAASGLAVGILCAAADAAVEPYFYVWFHLTLAGLSLAGFSLVVHSERLDRLPPATIATIAGLWAIVALAGVHVDRATQVIARHATVHRRAWTLFDRVWSGGASLRLPPPSCDDVEMARAAGGEGAARPAAHGTGAFVAPSEVGPQIVVLVTIDAFRCGFGQRDRHELREVCPELTKLLESSASYRLDAHAISPATRPSTAAMQIVQETERVGDRLRAAGVRSTVIATHPRILADPGVRASFDHVDETMVPRAQSGDATTSEETTDRAVATLRAMAADGRRHFLWVHYYDPHDPYVENPGSPWRGSTIPAYVAEVRRTDAAVARLIATVQRDLSASAVVVLTADHGEAFGEHRSSSHGINLYEETTRVPLAVWANDEDQRRALPADLPVGSSEIGRYLVAVAMRQPFVSEAQTRLFVDTPEDEQRGLVDDQGWKLIEHRSLGYTELFDLRSDPTEQHDLTRERPDVLLAMRCRLARAEGAIAVSSALPAH
jgi:hypothetical protein